MDLTDRLLGIANFIEDKSIVGDIGTDHGYIPAYLIEKGTAKKVIATDISSSSLKKAEELVRLKGLQEDIDLRIGDGLDVIKPYEVDTLIIAGMGGVLITDILKNNYKTARSINNFILNPMVAQEELRMYLYNNNFTIVEEKIVYEGEKYYEIIHAKWGKDFIEDAIYYEISKVLLKRKDPMLKQLIKSKIHSIEKIINDLSDESSARANKRKNELNVKMKKYMEVIEYYEGS